MSCSDASTRRADTVTGDAWSALHDDGARRRGRRHERERRRLIEIRVLLHGLAPRLRGEIPQPRGRAQLRELVREATPGADILLRLAQHAVGAFRVAVGDEQSRVLARGRRIAGRIGAPAIEGGAELLAAPERAQRAELRLAELCDLRLGRDRTLEHGEKLIEMPELCVHSLEAEQRRELGRIARERLRVRRCGLGELGRLLELLAARVGVVPLRARGRSEGEREHARGYGENARGATARH